MYDQNVIRDLIIDNELNKALIYLDDFNDRYSKIKKAEIYLLIGAFDEFKKNVDIKEITDNDDIYSINFFYIYYTLYEFDQDKRNFYKNLFEKNLNSEKKEALEIELKLREYVDKKYEWQSHELHYKSITSTNNVFKELLKEDDNLRVLVADEQVTGKGQKERKFYSPIGGLYISIKVKPKLEDIHYVTAFAGIAAIDACFKVTGKMMDIKRINDLYYDDKKVSGILTESKFSPEGEMDYAIIGIGLNLIKNKNIPMEYRDVYGYLIENGDYSISDIIENVKYYLIPTLLKIEEGIEVVSLLDSYNERLYKKNDEVEIYNKDMTHRGILIGVDDNLDVIINKDNGLYKYEYGDYRMNII